MRHFIEYTKTVIRSDEKYSLLKRSTDRCLIFARCHGRSFFKVEVQLCLLPDVSGSGEWDMLLRMLILGPSGIL